MRHTDRHQREVPISARLIYHPRRECRTFGFTTVYFDSTAERVTAFSVSLAICWRVRGEVQLPRALAPGHDKCDSDLRDRPSTPVAPYSRAEHTLAQQSAVEVTA